MMAALTPDWTMPSGFTTGCVTAYDIIFPGLAAFNNCCTGQGGGDLYVGCGQEQQQLGQEFAGFHNKHTRVAGGL